MKKDYNRATMSDMPMDSNLNSSSVETFVSKKPTKQKINVIGKNKQKNKKEEKVKKTEKEKLRTKLGSSNVDLADLEQLNEENLKAYRFTSRRNRFFIVLLSVLLAISIAAIATYLTITRLKANCNMVIHGSVDASYIVDGIEMNEFRAPSNLEGNKTLAMTIQIKIESGGRYKIKFQPQCYQKNVLMKNTLVYKYNTDLFYEGEDGVYYSHESILGKQTITLCHGIILDYEYRNTLNVDNFKLDFHTYFEKV